MSRLFALAVALCFASSAGAAPLLGTISLNASNVVNFDPGIFAPGAPVDVYHVMLNNLENSSPVTSLALGFPVNLVNRNSSATTFRNTSALPMLGPNNVAESFFVTPFPASEILAVGVSDTDTLLQAAYTRSGGGTFLAAGAGNTVVAVLSVPAGSPAPDSRLFRGSAVVNGVLQRVFPFLPFDAEVPEPSAALMAGLAAGGLLVRRR